MAHIGFLAFLFFLGLGVANASGENTTALCQNILNATLKNETLSGFNLTVFPDKLSNNTNYSVLLNGAGDFTVLLQAVTGSTPVGKWSAETDNCDGSPLFVNHSFTGKHINTTWMSPVNLTVNSVTIKVFLQNKTETFLLHQILLDDSKPSTNTTKAPSTGNHTEITKVTVTTHRVVKITSAASIEQSSVVSMALSLILGVLLIPNKYLS